MTEPYTRTMRLLIGVIVLGVLLLGACSDSSPDDETPVAAPAPATQAPASPGTTTPAAGTAAAGSAGVRRPAQAYDPNAFRLELDPVLSGLRAPLFVTAPPDGSGRLFVVEQGGTIRVVVNGQVQRQPFLDISSLVVSGGERGLLGMAFHPRYAENGRFFVMYTARGDGDNTVARYQVSSDPNRADPNSATVLLAIDDFAANHNAGMLAFGPDGYLYVGTGDGGGANDPQRTSQDLGAWLGKMLRLDVDGGEPYAVPRDNPFVGRGNARPEIWAYGLRNPWRYSFDRETGDLWIADVGQNRAEEINVQPSASRGGENYGWSIMEGFRCLRGDSCDRSGLTLPVAEYGRDEGQSVTGGYVYRGRAFPALTGAYLFADYVSGTIWSLHQGADGQWVRTELLDTDLGISSFGEDQDGELYLTDLRGGGVYRLAARPR
jgi:glucose/arabinose dehydrogenase